MHGILQCFLVGIVLGAGVIGTAGAQVAEVTPSSKKSGAQPVAERTPAERSIAQAKLVIAAHPKNHRGYNALAMGHARRARETADGAHYQRGLEALEHSFRIAPGNFEGQRNRVWIWLGQHEFERALVAARELNRKAPDDLMVYAMLTDACVELGHYEEAEKAVQWMLDLRPGNVAALTRGAYLRELFGDIEGAIDFFGQAFQSTRPSEVEDRAWILTHIGALERSRGRIAAAERVLEQALLLFEDYHYALAELSWVRVDQGKHPAAVRLMKRRYEVAGHPENLFELAQVMRAAGQDAAAAAAEIEFEAAALEETKSVDNANGQLIRYWLDQGRTKDALALARREAKRRQDVRTQSNLAWALLATGDAKDAQKEIAPILALGWKSAELFYRAGMIAAKAGDAKAANGHLQACITLQPQGEVSALARRAMEDLR